jgi:hypothetical protein
MDEKQLAHLRKKYSEFKAAEPDAAQIKQSQPKVAYFKKGKYSKNKTKTRSKENIEFAAAHAARMNQWKVNTAKKAGALVSENSYIDIPENTDILISQERARKIVEVKLQEDLIAAKLEQIRLKRAAYLQSIGQAVEE